MASSSRYARWCSAVNCTNSKQKRPELAFFRFPKDPERCRKWVINCRRADMDTQSSDHLHVNNYLCEEHFEQCCFSTTAVKRRRIKNDALPTLFSISNPPSRVTPSRPPPKQREPLKASKTPEASTPSFESQPTVITDVEAHPERNEVEESLKRKLCAIRAQNWRLKKKIKTQTSKSETSSSSSNIEKSIADIENILKDHLPAPALQFILTQIRISGLKKNARKWTSKEKSIALSIYHASRKAYALLQKIFLLPSPSTLSKSMRNINLQPGVCYNVVNMFKVKVATMTEHEKICTLVFDEMAIKCALKYNSMNDQIEGYEDYGEFGRSRKQADHALVFMFRGLSAKWKQPIAYFLSQSATKTSMLQPLVLRMIDLAFDIGLNLKVLICDQGSNNRAVLKKLGVSAQQPFFHLNERKIFVIYDPPHLIKNIRNNLKKSGFTVDGEIVSWDFIQRFYEMDSALPIRMAPKLTSRHVNVPAFSHLRVNLAVQVLSHSVAAGISTMVALGALPPEARFTAEFVERFDQLFNCLNSRCMTSKSTMSHSITSESRHVTFLQDTLDWLHKVKPCGTKSLNLPSLEGWKLSIEGLIQLWQHLNTECGFRFLMTSRLNQDCIENMFAVIRGKGGHRVNPEATEFRAALRQTMVDSVLVAGSSKNCQDDIDTFLFSLKHLVSSGASSTVHSRLQQDVPWQLQRVMTAAPDLPSLSNQEDNILAYIGGYIIRKLETVVCSHCKERLIATARGGQHTFICHKNFDKTQTSGLFAPSTALQDLVTAAERVFRNETPQQLHVVGIRSNTIRNIMERTVDSDLQCQNETKECDIRFLVINLFVNIRLHHLVRCTSREYAQHKTSRGVVRKAATFKHM